MTMRRAVLTLVVVALVQACATTAPHGTRNPPPHILGVRLNMPRAEVREVLARSGKLEREERKRQEVWSVDDPRFASQIVGNDKSWNVRFVTGVAKPEGAVVKYADVLDVPHAAHKAAGQTHTYTWTIEQPKYYVIAIGGAERLDYLSLKKDQ